MMTAKWLGAALVLGVVLQPISLRADENDKRERLLGTWESDEADARPARWIVSGDANKLHFAEFNGEKELGGFSCTPGGTPCQAKLSGKRVDVSMWFNGSKLVIMQTRGGDSFEQEFEVASDDVLEVKVMPLVPSGATQKHRFRRVKSESAK